MQINSRSILSTIDFILFYSYFYFAFLLTHETTCGTACYDSDNSPVYRGCPVRLRPLAAVFYVRWRPMGAADFTLSWRRFSGN